MDRSISIMIILGTMFGLCGCGSSHRPPREVARTESETDNKGGRHLNEVSRPEKAEDSEDDPAKRVEQAGKSEPDQAKAKSKDAALQKALDHLGAIEKWDFFSL